MGQVFAGGLSTEIVQDAVNRGMTRDESVSTLTDMIDRYPMDVEQAALAPMVMGINAGNLYDYLTGPWPPASMGTVATRLPTDDPIAEPVAREKPLTLTPHPRAVFLQLMCPGAWLPEASRHDAFE